MQSTTGEWNLIRPPDIAPWPKGNPQLNGGDRSFRYWPYIIEFYVCLPIHFSGPVYIVIAGDLYLHPTNHITLTFLSLAENLFKLL